MDIYSHGGRACMITNKRSEPTEQNSICKESEKLTNKFFFFFFFSIMMAKKKQRAVKVRFSHITGSLFLFSFFFFFLIVVPRDNVPLWLGEGPLTLDVSQQHQIRVEGIESMHFRRSLTIDASI